MGTPPKVILLMRHAEKPEGEGDPHLSAVGQARAKKLASYIPAKFWVPDFIIAAADSPESVRPRETVEPLSRQTDTRIQADIKDGDYGDLAGRIMGGRYPQGRGVVCWHHGKIPELLQVLEVEGDYPNPWNPEVFNLLLQIDFTGGGKPKVSTFRESF
jgi:phosphohistidine phosphatase SixA